MSIHASPPRFGAGFGYRPQWVRALLADPALCDWMEFIVEDFLDVPRRLLEDLSALQGVVPLVPHGVRPNVHGPGDPDARQLHACAALVARVSAPWFSIHLPYDQEAKAASTDPGRRGALNRRIAKNVRRVGDAVGVPLLLENIDYTDPMTPVFVSEVLEESDCGLLLNLGLLSRSALETGRDPLELLGAFPLHRIGEVHLTAGHEQPGTEVHFHGRPVTEEVWALLDHLTMITTVSATVVERDGGQHLDLAEASADVARARRRVARQD